MTNRRRYERVPFFCDLSLTSLSGVTAVAAHSFDISVGGVGVVAQVSLEPGCTVTLAFSLPDKSGRKVVNQVNGRVVRCDADSEANRLGIEFFEPLTAATSPQLIERIMKI
jgi:c-di-GMP-binding flagellar brake protein YcgR